MIKNITIGAFILALSFVGYTQAVHSGKPIKQYDTTDTLRGRCDFYGFSFRFQEPLPPLAVKTTSSRSSVH